MQNMSGNSLPYIRELPDVCLMQASLAGVTIRRQFQPGAVSTEKACHIPFHSSGEISHFLQIRNKDHIASIFQGYQIIPPTPFYNRELLILSSGKFKVKVFFLMFIFIEFHCMSQNPMLVELTSRSV